MNDFALRCWKEWRYRPANDLLFFQVTKECAWQDGAERDGLPDPGEVVILTYTVRYEDITDAKAEVG